MDVLHALLAILSPSEIVSNESKSYQIDSEPLLANKTSSTLKTSSDEFNAVVVNKYALFKLNDGDELNIRQEQPCLEQLKLLHFSIRENDLTCMEAFKQLKDYIGPLRKIILSYDIQMA